MVGATSTPITARAALTAAGTIGGGMLSGTNNFNETSALGLGVTHSLLHGPVPVRLPDLSQQTAPALPASIWLEFDSRIIQY